MKISDKEYEVLKKIAFGQCVSDCKECKYYYPGHEYRCFALDTLHFLLSNVKEDIDNE